MAARAAWLARHGIGPRDPVAVYVDLRGRRLPQLPGADLARRDPGADERQHAGRDRRRVHPAAARRRACSPTPTTPRCAEHDLGAPILGDAAETGTGDPAAAPPHYRHHPDDPVAITHSSGTTRMPAAVVHSHRSLFAAIRGVRLTEPRPHGDRCASCRALPAAHTAGIITVNQALCNGYELLFLSAQGGAFARSGEASWTPSSGGGRPASSASR